MKRGFILLISVFIIVLFFSVVFAQTETMKIKKAYFWLQGKAKGKWHNLDTKEHVFSLLTIQEKLNLFQINSSIRSLLLKSNNEECWPSVSCNAAETAIAKIALDSTSGLTGKDSSTVNEWLISQKAVPNIDWYLQLTQPSSLEVRCLINYEGSGCPGSGCEIIIDEEGKINVDSIGGCLTKTPTPPGPYWFRLTQSQECMEKTFSVFCNDSIGANFFFIKENNWYATGLIGPVPPQPAPPLNINVSSYCIKGQTGTCNYENTLWTAYAFMKQGQNNVAKGFMPYLIINYEETENQKYIPQAFLYELTSQQKYINELEALQGNDGLWRGGFYSEYYDTALVRLMTQGLAGDMTLAEETLLDEQETDGSWLENIRDTALILYAFWPNYEWRSECEIQGYSCVINCSDSGGIPASFYCPEFHECCNIAYDCESKYGICKGSCFDNETQVSYDCTSGICCKLYSISMCEAEIGGQVCSSSEECLDAQENIIQFITSADSSYCCLGTCTEASQTCQDAGGMYCDPNQGYSCQNNQWIQATDTIYCCEQNYCTQQQLSCNAKGGEICMSNEDCKNGVLVEATDTGGQAICCIQGGTCIPQVCNYEKCGPDEGCSGTMYETSDALRCCEGQCLKSCLSLGGTECNASLSCDGNIMQASDTTRCCLGSCKEKGKFPWIVAIIIFAVLIIGALFFLIKTGKIKLKRKPKAKTLFGPSFGPRPGLRPRPGMPTRTPIRRMPTRMPIRKPIITKPRKPMPKKLRRLPPPPKPS